MIACVKSSGMGDIPKVRFFGVNYIIVIIIKSKKGWLLYLNACCDDIWRLSVLMFPW